MLTTSSLESSHDESSLADATNSGQSELNADANVKILKEDTESFDRTAEKELTDGHSGYN